MKILDVRKTYSTLGEVIKHDKLFEAYPQMRHYGVFFLNIKGNGSFSPSFGDISLNPKLRNLE